MDWPTIIKLFLRSIINIFCIGMTAYILNGITSIHDLLVIIGAMLVGFYALLDDKIKDIK